MPSATNSFHPQVSILQAPLEFVEVPALKFQKSITQLLLSLRMYETNVNLGMTANWKFVILSIFTAFCGKYTDKEPKEIIANVLDCRQVLQIDSETICLQIHCVYNFFNYNSLKPLPKHCWVTLVLCLDSILTLFLLLTLFLVM